MRRFVLTASALVVGSALGMAANEAKAQCVIVKSSSARVVNPAPRCDRTRALLVTKSKPASPHFVVTTPVASRGSLADCRQPGAGYYGLADGTQARLYVRIKNAPGRTLGLRAVGLDPFQELPRHLPRRYRDAQEWWLYANGLVNRARLLKRVPASDKGGDDTQVESTALAPSRTVVKPTPRATIKIDPAARAGGDQRI